MKRTSFFLLIAVSVIIQTISACNTKNLIDTNVEVPKRNWTYTDKVTASVDIKDSTKAFNLKFKLRHTGEYRYANIYILMHLSGPGLPKVTRRYEYKLAESDGQWLGEGSGNLFTYVLPLLSDYHFPQSGHYNIEIEQNMRDNPLREISDVGIIVAGEENVAP